MGSRPRRGSSAVIATLLLVVVAVAAAVFFYMWVTSSTGEIEGEAGEAPREIAKIEGVSAEGTRLTIYVRNIGETKLYVDTVYFEATTGLVIDTAMPEGAPIEIAPGEVKPVSVDIPSEVKNAKSRVLIRVASAGGVFSNVYPINVQALSSGSTWLSEWSYRRRITVTERTGSTLYDYQVRIVLDSTTLDNPVDFFSKASYDDIRFTDSGGVNELSFYIELWDEVNLKAVVWVKVPVLEGGATTDIYMYYGNPGASSASNGRETCELFEDFEDYAVGSSASPPWTIFTTHMFFPYNPADFMVVNVAGQNSYQNEASSTAYPGGAYRDFSGSRYIVIGKVMDCTGGDNNPHPGVIFAFANSDNWDGIYLRESWNQIVRARVRGGSWSAPQAWSVPIDRGVWYSIMVKVDEGSAQVYLDGDYIGGFTDAIAPTSGVGFLFFNNGYNYGYFDNLCVMKYVVPEPGYAIGAEETPP